MKIILLAMALTLPASPQIESGEDPCISERKINTFLYEVERVYRNIDCQMDLECENGRVSMPLLYALKWVDQRDEYRAKCHEKYGKPVGRRNVM